MRQFAKKRGRCEGCGVSAHLWTNYARSLDFGPVLPGGDHYIQEPGDLHLPALCDDCELRRRGGEGEPGYEKFRTKGEG